MMRKGDLAQFPVDWVLRQASEEGLSGGIEFDTSPPVCVYLSDGDLYHAVLDGVDGDDGGELDEGAEERLRAEVVATLRRLLSTDEGWYFFHDLNHHPLRGAWQWSTERLLAEAAAGAAEEAAAADPLVEWAQVAVSLGPTAPPTPLGADAWELLRAVAGRREVAVVAAGLGWDRARLAATLAELAATGTLERHEPERPSGPVAAPIVRAAGAVGRTEHRPPAAPAAPSAEVGALPRRSPTAAHPPLRPPGSAAPPPGRLGRPHLVAVPMPPSDR